MNFAKRSLWSQWLMGFWLLMCLCRCNHVLASTEESEVDSSTDLYEAPIIGNTAALLGIFNARCQGRPLAITGVCKLHSECRRAIESGTCYSDGEQDYVCCIELKQGYVPKNQSEEDDWIPQAVKELNNTHDYPGCGIRRPFADETLPAANVRNKHGWPWMVEICIRQEFDRRRHVCGGTLITKRHVLTAAHCFQNLNSKNPLSNYVLLIGASVADHDYIAKFEDMEMEVGKEYNVQHIYIHEDYRKNFHYKDIALLVLNKEVKLSNYAVPVCLPSGLSQFPNDDIRAMVVGWKHTPNNDETPKMLQQVEIGIVPSSRCEKLFLEYNNTLPKGITGDMICASGGGEEQDACQNDTGGPLLISRSDGKWVLVGIVCFGLEGVCAKDSKPSVYTRVLSFVPWILEHVEDDFV